MEEDDVAAWTFYCENSTPFVRDYGLMPGLLAATRYRGVAREIFLAKLNMIHATVLEIRARVVEEASEISSRSARGSNTMFASERT
jgi:hypothetical protein